MNHLTSLIAKAKAATPGERVTVDSVNNGKVYVCLAGGPLSESLALCDSEANAAFIASCSPHLILALCELAMAAEALRNQTWQASIDYGTRAEWDAVIDQVDAKLAAVRGVGGI